MNKKGLLTLLILLMIFVFSGTGKAMVMEDLIQVPTADLVSGRGYVKGVLNPNQERTLQGVFLVDSRLEVGSIITFDKDGEPELGVLIKTLLLDESSNEPAIAAGIKNKDLYLVVSKNLFRGVRGHIGMGNGELEGLFVGFNKVINPVSISEDGVNIDMPTINLMGEYIKRKINLGVRLGIQKNLDLEFGVHNLDDFSIGMDFSF